MARGLRGKKRMARTVADIMNKELLALRRDLPAREVRELLRSFGVGAAPILDENRKPLGIVSLRDRLETDGCVSDVMTRPVGCVSMSSTIEAAAEQMARGDWHHLVVVDGTGAAVGMLSTLDLLRALLDLPARHPGAFPHWDPSTRTSWTDDRPLDAENSRHAPDALGVLLLVTSLRGERDAIVWVEACTNVRDRVLAYASRPTHQEPALTRVLALSGLRFRASHVEDPATRDAIARHLQSNLDHRPPPRGA
jgi:CBS domain-containing protein